MVNPWAIIRTASLAGIDLNLRGGRLYAPSAATIPPDLAAALREHKTAIIAALDTLSRSADLWATTCERSDVPTVTHAGALEAAALAGDLARTGGLGQFVCDLIHTWNDLNPDERAAACHAWHLVPAPETQEIAA